MNFNSYLEQAVFLPSNLSTTLPSVSGMLNDRSLKRKADQLSENSLDNESVINVTLPPLNLSSKSNKKSKYVRMINVGNTAPPPIRISVELPPLNLQSSQENVQSVQKSSPPTIQLPIANPTLENIQHFFNGTFNGPIYNGPIYNRPVYNGVIPVSPLTLPVMATPVVRRVNTVATKATRAPRKPEVMPSNERIFSIIRENGGEVKLWTMAEILQSKDFPSLKRKSLWTKCDRLKDKKLLESRIKNGFVYYSLA